MSEITPETLLTAGGLVLMTIAVWWGGKAVKGWFWAFYAVSAPARCWQVQRAGPVLATPKDSTPRYGGRLLRRGISTRPMSGWG